MKTLFKVIFIGTVIFFIGSPINAYAYLDPGTGSMILQALAAGFLAVGVFWRNILSFLKGFGKKNENRKD